MLNKILKALKLKKKIALIIEDSIDIIYMMKQSMSKMGFIIDIATNGEDGLNKYYNNRYDLIITDIGLPKVNGNDIVQLVSQSKKIMPLIIMTGDTSYKNDTYRYIYKPFRLHQLKSKINEVLKIRI